jgi:hypothetical protein
MKRDLVDENAVRAASAAQATALRDLPPATARAAIDALRALLISLGDAALAPARVATSSGARSVASSDAARDCAASADAVAGGRPSAGEGR